MEAFYTRLILLLGLACVIPCLQANMRAQESRRDKQEKSSQQNQYRDQSQSLQDDQQQHELQGYRGKISTKHGNYYLEAAYTRESYLLQGTHEANNFLNKKVRVTGWLDTDKNILHVVALATAP